MPKAVFYLLALIAVVLFPEVAFAQMAENNLLDGIVLEFRDKSALWTSTLSDYAIRLFWILAGIEFAWSAIALAFRNADLQEWVAELLRRVLFIGIFLAILLNAGPWMGAIVDSFRQAANGANAAAGGTAGLSPSDIFDTGMSLAGKIYDELSLLDPIRSLGLYWSGLIIGVVFALIAAQLMIALVEMYIVLNAGVILLGFGGSQWTKDAAIQFIKYAVSVGAKLFILQLIVGLGEAFTLDWLSDFSAQSYHEVTILLGASVFLLVVVWMVPGIVQSIITGVSYSSGSAMMGAAAGMMTAARVMGAAAGKIAGTAAAGAGAGSAVREAVKLSQTQLGSGDGLAGAGRRPSAASIAKQTVSNLGQAGVEEARRKVRGWHAANERRGGTMGGRMAANMEEKRLSMEASNSAPTSPSSGPTPSSGGGTIRAGEAANDPGTGSNNKAG